MREFNQQRSATSPGINRILSKNFAPLPAKLLFEADSLAFFAGGGGVNV